MSLLRFFMILVRPSNERLRNAHSNNQFIGLILKFYSLLLKQLCKSYLHYAVSDTILLHNGQIRIVHEYRDTEFENELRRNGIDIKPTMLTSSLPLKFFKSKNKSHFRYFKFKNLLSIYIKDQELFLMHDSHISIDGNVKAIVKKSASNDIICRSIVELGTENIVNGNHTNAQQNIDTNDQQIQQNGIFANVQHVRQDRHNEPLYNNKQKNEIPEIIGKRGFNIDTSF